MKLKSMSRLANWHSSFTYPERYFDIGVAEHLSKYLLQDENQKDVLSVLDVGCSTGIALKTTKEFFNKYGIKLDVTGIDVRNVVKDAAEKNLDSFILGDFFEIDLPKRFDVIICTNMLLNMKLEKIVNALKKMALLLTPNGCLITNTDSFTTTSTKKEFLTQLDYSFKLLKSMKYGWNGIYQEFRRQEHDMIVRRMKSFVGENQVFLFVDLMLKNWNELSQRDKNFLVFAEYLCRLLGYIGNKPKNRNPSIKG